MENENYKNEILKDFHQQFAQNQNHHQRLFIQFISALIVVLVAYGYVVSNIGADAEWLYSKKNEQGTIISYSLYHLYLAYILAQIIFVLLLFIVINMGYNYRRDQKVSQNIRDHFINNHKLISAIFTGGFEPDKLNIFTYLPGFHKIFFMILWLIQIGVFISVQTFIKTNAPNKCLWEATFVSPVIVSLIAYGIYYNKYHKRVAKK